MTLLISKLPPTQTHPRPGGRGTIGISLPLDGGGWGGGDFNSTQRPRIRALACEKAGRFIAAIILILTSLAGDLVMAQASEPTRLLVLGDSLAAGFGLPRAQAFPERLQAHLARLGLNVEVINGGVSGDTTAGGLARLHWALAAAKPHVVLVELGGNDALRGLDPKTTYDNLDRIIARLTEQGIKVLLAGMRAPPNLGREYQAEFDPIFPALAKKHGVALYDFFLHGVAADPALNQPDGIHPNARGVEAIVERIAPYVQRLIDGS